MANTGKNTPPRNAASTERTAVPTLTDPSVALDTRLSPKVEALRRLVASGQYQVSPRYLAYRIMRAAGVKPE